MPDERSVESIISASDATSVKKDEDHENRDAMDGDIDATHIDLLDEFHYNKPTREDLRGNDPLMRKLYIRPEHWNVLNSLFLGGQIFLLDPIRRKPMNKEISEWALDLDKTTMSFVDFVKFANAVKIGVSCDQVTLKEVKAQEITSETLAQPIQRHVDVPEGWKTIAAEQAKKFIELQASRDLYPSQEDIADEIARHLRIEGIYGVDGKPLSGATIKRHSLKGISSAHNKQLSMKINQGK